MPHVVTENCNGCRFTDCVTVCPVECFHCNDERLFIDPDLCIDCGACIPICPVHAIYDSIEIPEQRRTWITINAKMARELPMISDKQAPPPTALLRKAELGF